MSEVTVNKQPKRPVMPPGRGKSKKIIATLAVLIVLSGGVYAYEKFAAPKSAATTMTRTYDVKRGDVTETVSASGTVQSPQQIKLNFAGGNGAKITSLKVKVGDKVKAGQVLATLDSQTATSQLANAQANVDAAKARLVTAQQGSTPQAIAIQQASVDKAKVALDGAKLAYQNQLTQFNDRSAAQQAITTAQNQVASAQVSLTNARAGLDSAKAKLAAAQAPASQDAIDAAKAQLSSAQQQLDSANLQLNTAMTTTQQISAKNAVASAQASVANADKALADLLRGPDPNTVAQAQASVTQAQAQVDQAQLNYNTALQGVKTAQDNYNNRTTAQAAVDQAKNSMEQAQASYNSALAQLAQTQMPPDAATVQAAQASVAQAQASLQQQQAAVDALSLKAPIDGVVTTVNGNVGELAANSTPVVVLDDASSTDMQITAQVSQTDVGKLKIGQDATFTTTSYENKTFKGKVLMIAPEATTANGVTTYAVTLSVGNSDNLLKPGMTTNVTITVGQHKNVLYVPTTALKQLNGRDGVYVAGAATGGGETADNNSGNGGNGGSSDTRGNRSNRNGGSSNGGSSTTGAAANQHFQPVTIGYFSSDKVEITSGLEEGQQVVVTFTVPSGTSTGGNNRAFGGAGGFGGFGGGGFSGGGGNRGGGGGRGGN